MKGQSGNVLDAECREEYTSHFACPTLIEARQCFMYLFFKALITRGCSFIRLVACSIVQISNSTRALSSSKVAFAYTMVVTLRSCAARFGSWHICLSTTYACRAGNDETA